MPLFHVDLTFSMFLAEQLLCMYVCMFIRYKCMCLCMCGNGRGIHKYIVLYGLYKFCMLFIECMYASMYVCMYVNWFLNILRLPDPQHRWPGFMFCLSIVYV